MDEKTFLGKWIAASRGLRYGVGDVREGVWDAIERQRNADGFNTLDCLPGRGTLLKLDFAAVIVIAVGSGLLYSVLRDFNTAVLWNGPLHTLANSYL